MKRFWSILVPFVTSIRLRLMLMSFVLVYAPVYFLNHYAVKAFDDFTSKALEEEMIGHAFMFGEQYKAMVLGLGESGMKGMDREFAALLKSYGPQVQSRLRVVSPSGVILFDSGTETMVGRDISDRLEIARAMAGQYKARWQLSEDGKHVFYYSALPIMHGDEVVGIAYVSRHTGQITKAILAMKDDHRLAMVTALVAALLVSAVLAQTMTRRLRRLTRAANEYARDGTPLDVEIPGRDEIGELGQGMQYMATEIEKRNQYNREFMSTVMHELKAPITAIKGAAEILEGGGAEKPAARAKFLGNIRYEAARLDRMVGELNELTKLDAEMFSGKKEQLDYVQCLRDILDRLMPTFDQAHAGFSVSLPDEPVPVMLVPGRIEQVVANLLENAFRYTPVSGTVTLSVATQDDGTVLTSVADTGPGIPGNSLEKIFERFYTTEAKDVPKDYGSGLGLSVARTIVENHKGRIRAESSPSGATLSFTLPIAD